MATLNFGILVIIFRDVLIEFYISKKMLRKRITRANGKITEESMKCSNPECCQQTVAAKLN